MVLGSKVMASIDAALESRSEEESDAGSLVDFICEDSEVSDEDMEDRPVELVSSYVLQGGLRRSMRSRAQPQRYVDEHFVELMTEDATIEDVLSQDGSSASEHSAASASETEQSEDSDYEAGDDSSDDSEEVSEEVSEEDSEDDSEDDSVYEEDSDYEEDSA